MKSPRILNVVLIISLTFYFWYLLSAIFLPLGDFIKIPEFLLITAYNLAEFPISILGFVVCVSLASTIFVLKEFKAQKNFERFLLTEGISLTMCLAIPVISTFIFLGFLFLGLTSNIPSEIQVSKFLEDLIIFSAILSVLTLILNIATQKLLQMGDLYSVKKKVSKKDHLKDL